MKFFIADVDYFLKIRGKNLVCGGYSVNQIKQALCKGFISVSPNVFELAAKQSKMALKIAEKTLYEFIPEIHFLYFLLYKKAENT